LARLSLSAALADRLPAPLDWDESAGSPYFTDKPTWDCYSDLLLWAAYKEQHHLPRPEQHVDEWSEDPAYRLSSRTGFQTSYSHLFDVELWFPCEFGFVFHTEDIGGNEILVGSSITLLEQLQKLNSRTWRADSELLHQWDGADHGAPLEAGARFAFALFSDLTSEAIKHSLPMCLDS
jgi:hypothetical protein